MKKSILYISVDPKLKKRVLRRAKADGFSSIQELVRYFLEKMIAGKVKVSLEIE